MYCVAMLMALLAHVSAQTNLTIAAAGAVPSGNSAVAGGQGTGEDVVGEAIIAVTDTGAVSGVQIAATGPVESDPKEPEEPKEPKEPTSAPATSTATATAAATASGSGVASASADAAATVTVHNAKDKTNGDDKDKKQSYVYYKKLVEKKEKPTCKDIEDDMCPAMGEFDNCGYCIIEKYPLKGYGCLLEKYYTKKEDKKGEYELVVKPACDCPEGAVVIEKVDHCPSCELALMELLVCSGYDKMPEDMNTIEIKAECLEKVHVTPKYLEECGYIKLEPSLVVITVVKEKEMEKEKDPKKYMIVDPIVDEKKEDKKDSKKYVVVEPENGSDETTGAGAITATATATASAGL
eukprot:TRINITY_DN111_c0_g1_i12.p1 TRINITY_DN111_c0_g1~~TRINITY_DN111_c0_g1_i12.p1  ORF type:complete len:399 (+),score=79.14 TRINITY_DN111_c0_g1_i12:145-1197(+)